MRAATAERAPGEIRPLGTTSVSDIEVDTRATPCCPRPGMTGLWQVSGLRLPRATPSRLDLWHADTGRSPSTRRSSSVLRTPSSRAGSLLMQFHESVDHDRDHGVGVRPSGCRGVGPRGAQSRDAVDVLAIVQAPAGGASAPRSEGTTRASACRACRTSASSPCRRRWSRRQRAHRRRALGPSPTPQQPRSSPRLQPAWTAQQIDRPGLRQERHQGHSTPTASR